MAASNPFNLTLTPYTPAVPSPVNVSGTPKTPTTTIKPITTPQSNAFNLTLPGDTSTVNSGLNQNGKSITTQVPKPTPVVSSNTASNTASNIKTNILNPVIQAQTQKAQALYDTSTGFVTPFGLSQGAKPVQANDPAMAKTGTTTTPPATTTPTTNPLEQAQTDAVLHPDQTQLYNLSNGQQEWVDNSKVTNGTANGYSTNNPSTIGATATVAGNNGETYKQFPDGTYGMFDAAGNYVTAANSAQFQAAKETQAAMTALDNVRNGIYSPTQQAQLDAIQSTYQSNLAKLNTNYANLTGATTIAENRNGLGNQIIGQQQITKTVTDGVQAIADLTATRDAAIAQMKSGFESDDMKAVSDAYTIYNTSSQNIQNEINKTKAALDTAQAKQEASDQSFATTMAGKYGDTIDPIDPYNDDKNAVLQKLKTSPSYIADQNTKAGTVDQDVLDGMLKIYNKTGGIPAAVGTASIALKKAFYAAIGGNTNLADDATANKAALGAATKALNTQQTQYSATQTSVGTLKSSMDRLENYVKPLVDSGSPLLNKTLRSLSGNVLGSQNYSAFQNEMNTIATEYAKILNGASASISGVSVSSVDDIKKAFNESVTTGQLETVLDAMKQDVNARLVSQKSTINQITSDIHDLGNGGSTSNSPDTTTSTGSSIWDF